MDKDSVFASDRLWFRGIREEDAPVLVGWRSDPEVIRYFRSPSPVTPEGHRNWFRTDYQRDPCRFDFLIVEETTAKAIGVVGANHLDSEKGSCEISYMIGESSSRGKGYAAEAVAALLETLAREGIHSFCAEIHRENAPSIRLVEKLGFVPTEANGDFRVYRKGEA